MARIAILIVGAAYALLSPVPSAGQVNSAPFGYIAYRLVQSTITPIGVPLMDDSVFTGRIAALTANSITASGVNWTAGEFAQAGRPYFAMLLSGGQTGRILSVTGNSPTALTLDTGNTSLAGDAATPSFAAAVNDRFELVAGDTLGGLFGDGSEVAPLLLQGGTSPFNADTVQIFNGVKWVSYFFDTSLGRRFWVKQGGDGTSQNALTLFPDAGLLIARRGPTTTITVLGRVPTNSLLTQIPGGTSAKAVRFPVDTTLATLNLAGPGTWVAGDTPETADKISLFNGIRWVAYWKTSAGVWKQVNGDGSNQGAKFIPAGTCLLVQKLGSATDSTSFFSQALPYPAN
jgi:uncharacterized protein (TIGR02597 family)